MFFYHVEISSVLRIQGTEYEMEEKNTNGMQTKMLSTEWIRNWLPHITTASAGAVAALAVPLMVL